LAQNGSKRERRGGTYAEADVSALSGSAAEVDDGLHVLHVLFDLCVDGRSDGLGELAIVHA
jgi:hypothetical protein